MKSLLPALLAVPVATNSRPVPMNEFELIRRYFSRPAPSAVLGVGDDAAILRPRAGYDLHISTDMLVSGRHFFPDTDPYRLGHKTLAVNLSDMAAMGAQPRWVTLSAALPSIEPTWVAVFAEGLFALADQFSVDVIGGDTTRGPLTFSVTIGGETPAGTALRRDYAQIGDDIWVSGPLGLAAAGLAFLQGRLPQLPLDLQAQCVLALEQPMPRVAFGQALLARGLAHAALDISDGLLGDLQHILQRSDCGAELMLAAIPSLPWLTAQGALTRDYIVAGGDDYELCFTAPVSARAAITALGEELGLSPARIGRIVSGHSCRLIDESNKVIDCGKSGFDHFNTP